MTYVRARKENNEEKDYYLFIIIKLNKNFFDFFIYFKYKIFIKLAFAILFNNIDIAFILFSASSFKIIEFL